MYLVVANWKMNPTSLKRAKLLFNSIKKGVKNIIKNACPAGPTPFGKRVKSFGVEVVICPPFPYLYPLFCDRKKYGIELGAQDCFWQTKGPFTGEISPLMLKDSGCQYVIIGHSERRALGETDEIINKKLKAVLKAKLKPILCIGETEKERKEGKTEEILKRQLKLALDQLPEVESLVVAYEPIWAIGTGLACDIPEAKKANLFVRKTLNQLTNLPTYKLLYGGSVNSKNAKDYIEKAGFQGLLVGGVSLKAKEFIKIVREVILGLKFNQN